MNMRISDNVLSFIFYSILGVALLTAFSSNIFLPGGDIQFHTANIIDAKIALQQHQFPLRISPHMHEGLGYAQFQFYAPIVYLVGGILNFFIKNPFVVYKILLLVTLSLSGFFIYRLTAWLTHERGIGFLCGVVYMTAPYLLINLTSRQDFTETLGQALLPWAIYYSARLFGEKKLSYFIWVAIAWAILAMTHLISFVYGALFFSLFIVFLTLVEKKYWSNLLIVFLAMSLGKLLAAWYLAPILWVSSDFNIHHALGNPFNYNFMTSLSSLFSLKPLSPMPIPSNNTITGEGYISLGIPLVSGFIICAWVFLKDGVFMKEHQLVKALMLFYALIFFAVWSPIDCWSYLPKLIVIMQFSYRLITELMVVGSVLFGFALLWVFKGAVPPRFIFILVILIILFDRPWLHNMAGGPNDTIDKLPAILIHSTVDDYMTSADLVGSKASSSAVLYCHQHYTVKNCEFQNNSAVKKIVLPVLYYRDLLQIAVNKMPVVYDPVVIDKKVLTEISVSRGTNVIAEKFLGLRWANWVSAIAWMVVGVLWLARNYRVFSRTGNFLRYLLQAVMSLR